MGCCFVACVAVARQRIVSLRLAGSDRTWHTNKSVCSPCFWLFLTVSDCLLASFAASPAPASLHHTHLVQQNHRVVFSKTGETHGGTSKAQFARCHLLEVRGSPWEASEVTPNRGRSPYGPGSRTQAPRSTSCEVETLCCVSVWICARRADSDWAAVWTRGTQRLNLQRGHDNALSDLLPGLITWSVDLPNV